MNIKLWYSNRFHKGKRIDQDKLQKQWQKEFDKKIRDCREAGVDEYDIEQMILSHSNEGRNVDKKGYEFWVCSHCMANIKFKTREEYVAHHQRVHS